ncbi:MAG: HNH endonuclease [Desulfuromonadales bacterium]|nr:HNH endonuclease [Desulfuromonadales bacterium]
MRWTEDQLRLALALYCQIPFGKMHSRNPDIIDLAQLIGRTPSAVSMKLVNFASLDPEIVNSGRAGLGNASALDRKVWGEFQADWEASLANAPLPIAPAIDTAIPLTGATTRKGTVEIRTKQSIFRRMVLSNYVERCCISGLSDARLLVASHILPWGNSKEHRLNPHNGLCLSVLHDKAFDRGLLTIRPDLTVAVSSELKKLKKDLFAANTLVSLHGASIHTAEKFRPDREFLEWHNREVFIA